MDQYGMDARVIRSRIQGAREEDGVKFNEAHRVVVVGTRYSGKTTLASHLVDFAVRRSYGIAAVDRAGDRRLSDLLEAQRHQWPVDSIACDLRRGHRVQVETLTGMPVVIDMGPTVDLWREMARVSNMILITMSDLDAGVAEDRRSKRHDERLHAFAASVGTLALNLPRVLVVSRLATTPPPIDLERLRRLFDPVPAAALEVGRWPLAADATRNGYTVWSWPAEVDADRRRAGDDIYNVCEHVFRTLGGRTRPPREHVRDRLWATFGVPALPSRPVRVHDPLASVDRVDRDILTDGAMIRPLRPTVLQPSPEVAETRRRGKARSPKIATVWRNVPVEEHAPRISMRTQLLGIALAERTGASSWAEVVRTALLLWDEWVPTHLHVPAWGAGDRTIAAPTILLRSWMWTRLNDVAAEYFTRRDGPLHRHALDLALTLLFRAALSKLGGEYQLREDDTPISSYTQLPQRSPRRRIGKTVGTPAV